jgi:hypothetical protein
MTRRQEFRATAVPNDASPPSCSVKIKCGKCLLVASVMGRLWFWSSIHIRVFLFRSVLDRFVLEKLMDGNFLEGYRLVRGDRLHEEFWRIFLAGARDRRTLGVMCVAVVATAYPTAINLGGFRSPDPPE